MLPLATDLTSDRGQAPVPARCPRRSHRETRRRARIAPRGRPGRCRRPARHPRRHRLTRSWRPRESADTVSELSHLDDQGRARMVDVSAKADTTRTALAAGDLVTTPEVVALVRADDMPKADVLATARIAGIAAREADLGTDSPVSPARIVVGEGEVRIHRHRDHHRGDRQDEGPHRRRDGSAHRRRRRRTHLARHGQSRRPRRHPGRCPTPLEGRRQARPLASRRLATRQHRRDRTPIPRRTVASRQSVRRSSSWRPPASPREPARIAPAR